MIDNFASLPGIGQKTAERLVYYLLKNERDEKISDFGNNLLKLKKEVYSCPVCGNYINSSSCTLCNEPKRDRTKICLVAEAQDIWYLEKMGTYNGLYHVLNGLVDPINGITAEKLNITALGKRLPGGIVKENKGFNPTMEGGQLFI